MRMTLILFIFTILSIGSFAQDQWTIDPVHSSLNFNISQSGISMVNGKFQDYTGDLTMLGKDFESANIDFTIQVKSINTNVEMRDNHLRSDDFFEVETYPTMTFKSTKVLATGKPDYYLLYG